MTGSPNNLDTIHYDEFFNRKIDKIIKFYDFLCW